MPKSKFWYKHNLGLLLIAVLLLVLPLAYLFLRSRLMLKQEAMQRAEAVLNITALQVANYLIEIETATRNVEWQVLDNMHPDSLLAFSRRVVEHNPHVNGCSITTEPDYFPHLGRYFSAYSVREADSITTVREAAYEYFDKVWYKSSRDAKKAVWVDPYDDFNAGTLYSSDMIASYSAPLYQGDSTFVGIISTDISLPKVSKVIASATPYDDSYCIMTGKQGNYLVYPDSDRLLYHTIFDGVNSRLQPDIIELGNDMVAGNKGNKVVDIDGRRCIVFYQPVRETGWSIAIVCPVDSILKAYNQLGLYFVPLFVVGVIVMLFYNRRGVRRLVNRQ